MKTINRSILAGLCMCLICIQTNVSAAPKENVASRELQQAYNLLFEKKPVNRATNNPARSAATKKINARLNAITVAKKQIHRKYRWGGTSPGTGFDCSGLMHYAYKLAKINLPRTAAAQYKATKRVSLAKLQMGDLIFFHTRRTRARVNHVGLYLGGGKFIHAPRKGKRVSIASLSNYWRSKAVGAGRV